jgi:hypothetical protein
MGEKMKTYRVLWVSQKEKEPLERPRRKWENNIKMNLWE